MKPSFQDQSLGFMFSPFGGVTFTTGEDCVLPLATTGASVIAAPPSAESPSEDPTRGLFALGCLQRQSVLTDATSASATGGCHTWKYDQQVQEAPLQAEQGTQPEVD